MARWILPQSTVYSDTIVNLGLSGNVLVQQNLVLETTGGQGAIIGEGSNHQVMVFGSIDGYAIGIQLGDNEAEDHSNSLYVAQDASVSSYGRAVWLEGSNSHLVNDGTIGSSTTAIGVFMFGSSDTTTTTVVNNGVIEAQIEAIHHQGTAGEKFTVVNTGTISAGYNAILTGIRDDLVSNSGQIIGAIYLGPGDDVYRGERGAVNGLIFGDAGDDRIYCGAGNNEINGSYGADIIRGGAGADIMSGGEGLADTLEYRSSGAGIRIDLATGAASGGDAQGDVFAEFEKVAGTEFADTIAGDGKNNTLAGYSGDDQLTGRDGNDILRGGFGSDRLFGGRGADKLHGGDEGDVFQFKAASDSTLASTGRDTIFDFTSGDKIDLSGIDANTTISGNQAFIFLGTAIFTGRKAELRYEKSASDTYVYADFNGDKKADFAIHLDDAVALQSGAFVL